MDEIVLFHHIQGLTPGVQAFADELRRAGHVVHVPDLFDGWTFPTIQAGFAHAQSLGMDAVHARGLAAADRLGTGLVYAGFSFGAAIAQELAQTRPDAAGALLFHSCMPVTEYSPTWPDAVPVQVHGMVGDEFFDEDLPAARDLVASAPAAELFTYTGEAHLFTDSSLEDHDPDATALLLERVLAFLQRR